MDIEEIEKRYNKLPLEDRSERSLALDFDWLISRVKELEADNQRLDKWVGDLQSGMYINCVYCGHQYPRGTPGVMQEILYEHIRKCQKHPLRKAEAKLAEEREKVKRLEEGLSSTLYRLEFYDPNWEKLDALRKLIEP